MSNFIAYNPVRMHYGIGAPISLADVGIGRDNFPEIINQMNNHSVNGNIIYMDSTDYAELVILME